MGKANAGVTKGRSVVGSFFILFLVTVPISANMRTIEADKAEECYFRGIEFYIQRQYYAAALEFRKAIKLKSDYAEARNAFESAYAKLESGDSTVSASSSIGACLGAYSGCIFGCAIPLIVTPVGKKDAYGYPEISSSLQVAGIILGAIGAIAGGYLGWKAYHDEDGRLFLYSASAIACGFMLVYLPERLGLLPH